MFSSNLIWKWYAKLLLMLSIFISSGCASYYTLNDEATYANQRSNPIAMPHTLLIDGLKRDYFTLERKHQLDKNGNKHLILKLSGSGCGDSQPLLGFLLDLPIEADIAVLQKRGVKRNDLSDISSDRCSKAFLLHDNFANRVNDNLQLLQHLKQIKSYNRITLLGVSEGVMVAYLMMNQDPSLREAVLLANHAAVSIKDSYQLKAERTLPQAKFFQKLLKMSRKQSNDNSYVGGKLIKNWRLNLNIDRRNMAEVLSRRKDARYLFIMGENDNILPSDALNGTKKIFCKNRHSNNLILLKKKADHIVLRSPRKGTHKIIVDWMNRQRYQQNTDFVALACKYFERP